MCIPLFNVASCSCIVFIFTVDCTLYEYVTVYSSFHPGSLMVVPRVCIMNRAAMNFLFHVFWCICARVFLGYMVIFKKKLFR